MQPSSTAYKQVPRDAALAELGKRHFVDFVHQFWDEVPGAGQCVWNWHLDVLCEELQKVAERVFAGLPKEYDEIFNVSPGTSKSTICSILFPAWVWTRMPEARFICASHTETLVMDLANKARYVIQSERYKKYYPHVQIRDDRVGYYTNTAGGDRLSCTVAGKTPTGFHAHFLIVDDPLDPKQALSQALIKNAGDFMTTVLPSRKVDKEVSVTFLIMQRLHELDPAGVLLKKAQEEGGARVRLVRLPAELFKGDDGAYLPGNVSPPELARRYVNGLMDPSRLGAKVLREQRVALGEYGYTGQYLQNPITIGGGMFKAHYFNKRVKAAPYNSRRIRSWDRACLVGDTSVETVRGPVPIKDVQVGDMVRTRQGYRRVLWSGKTKEVDRVVSVTFANGAEVTGTEDHRVWTEEFGWCPLATLDGGCYNDGQQEDVSWLRNDASEKKSYSTGSSTAATQAAGISKGIGTIRRRERCATILCTGPSGDTITETYPTGMTYITKTEIGITTACRISSACRERNITVTTESLPDGIKRKPAEGISKSSCGHSENGKRPCRNESSCVCPAVKRLRRSTSILNALNSAVVSVPTATASELSPGSAWSAASAFGTAPVRRHARRNARRRTGRRHARCVGWCLKESSGHSDFVRKGVGRSGSIPVYDLVVEGAHEFFANGILVHNSTADGGCGTAGVLLAKAPNGDYYVEHVVWGQWEPDERNAHMRATALRDRARYGKYGPQIWVEREGGSAGRDAWKAVARALEGFAVREATVTGDKDHRAEPWSCQLAAGNVWMVEDGTWDLEAYIHEHVLFRPEVGKRGRLKDRVDASSQAFNLFVNQRPAGTIYTYPITQGKKKKFNIVACPLRQLDAVGLQVPYLLVILDDPGDTPPVTKPGACLDVLRLAFADLDPADYQDRWNDPVPPYNVVPEKLVMLREQGKKLWSFLRKHRDPPACAYVFCDGGDRRALAVAAGVCEKMGFKKDETIETLAIPEGTVGNPHVYATVKAARETVI